VRPLLSADTPSRWPGGDGLHGRPRFGYADLPLQPADIESQRSAGILEILELAGKHIVAHADRNPEHVRTAERHDSFEIPARTQDRVGRAIQG